jgi:hypothetical protein
MKMRGLWVALLVGVSAAASCDDSGGGGGAPGASGVASSKRIDSLTDAEKALLCDWTNAKLGGYGGSVDCGGGFSLNADASQAECVADWFTTCAATVAQGEACANASSCADPIPAACAPIASCTRS